MAVNMPEGSSWLFAEESAHFASEEVHMLSIEAEQDQVLAEDKPWCEENNYVPSRQGNEDISW
jgi:hypothetical protein